MKKAIVLILCCFIVSIAGLALATNLTIEGDISYSIHSPHLTLNVDRIVNNESNGASGSLKLSLHATTTPYTGGTISGYNLGEYQFSTTLSGGQYFYDIEQTIEYNAPPAGIYYLTLLLLEYTGSDYYIIHHVSFSEAESLGNGGNEDTPGPDGDDINSIDDCNNAWTGSDTDHSKYYCEAACGYYAAGHDQGFSYNCDILSATYEGALDNCHVCSLDISTSPALNSPSSNSDSDSSSGSGDGCFILTLGKQIY